MAITNIIDVIIFLGVIFQGVALNFGDKYTGFPLYLYTVGQVLAVIWFLSNKLNKKVSIFKLDLALGIIFIYSIISLSFPLLFIGEEINYPRIGIEDQYQNHSKLSFNISSIGQVAYLFLNIITLQYFKLSSCNKAIVEKRFRNLQLICIISILFGLWQMISKYTGFYYPSKFLYSSCFGTNLEDSIINSGYSRICSTFFEASYFGAFMTASFFLSLTLVPISKKYILLAAASLLMIIISTSWGSVFALFILTGIIIFKLIFKKSTYTKKIFSIKHIIIFCFLFIFLYMLFSDFISNYLLYIATKSESLSLVHRLDADRLGLIIFYKTMGLGVGIGNNATSSLLPYVLSNLGIVGSALFAVVIFLIINKYNINFNYRAKSYTIAFASILLNMLISIGSINFSLFWIFIFLIYSERSFNERTVNAI